MIMKIIQINAVYKFASTGRTTMEMHEYCLQHGIESHVFCPNMSDEEHNIYIIGSKLDHKLHALWSRVFGKQAFFSAQLQISVAYFCSIGLYFLV